MNPNSLTNNVNQPSASPTTINTNNRENREDTTQNNNSRPSVQSAASNIANAFSASLQATEPLSQFHQEAIQASEGEYSNRIATMTQRDEQSSVSSDNNKGSGNSTDDDKKMPANSIPTNSKSTKAEDQKIGPFHADAIAGTKSHNAVILSLTETDSKKSPSKNENSSKDESTILTNSERLEKIDASRTFSVPHVASQPTIAGRQNSSSSPKSQLEKPIANSAVISESTINNTPAPLGLQRFQAPLSQPGAYPVQGPNISRTDFSTSAGSDASHDSSFIPTLSATDSHPLIDHDDHITLPLAAEVDETTMREGEDFLTPYDPEIPVSNAYIATRQAPQPLASAIEPDQRSDVQSDEQSSDHSLNQRNIFQSLCLDPIRNCIRFFNPKPPTI